MKLKPIFTALLLSQLTLAGTTAFNFAVASDHHAEEKQEAEKGPNNGRMLRDGNFAVELSIFETGVPPEFRTFITQDGKPVSAKDVKINVKLTRLGNVIDDINFFPEGGYLRGDMEIYEPHSFIVTLSATYQGKTHTWSYDNFEGRVELKKDVADAMGITTEKVGPQTMHDLVNAYGRLEVSPNAMRDVSARFAGEVSSLKVGLGEVVEKGQTLMTVISNDSLQPYTIKAPISGVITVQNIRAGEQTGEMSLLTITDTSKLTAKINVFGAEIQKIKPGMRVDFKAVDTGIQFQGEIKDSLYAMTPEQAKVFRIDVDNKQGLFSPGQFISADVEVSSYQVPMAVKKVGLQAFRDFTVVYRKIGDEYEVRMLELGRESGPWVEVLGGIKSGADYVVGNSYLIKADIEKSGASHDH
ncbi:efflux RND transporter periplasmic adaptor subunit [Parashewanella tropica]|uniref:efflux RND transporter periplasmic adaptor subunit n=1 Tax=Parashewanella tropica TaxID=2547970 RepID=UPI00105A6784|nr:efflux RND transporter periplasmic adaptor subunit [Parashewanella tropica]